MRDSCLFEQMRALERRIENAFNEIDGKLESFALVINTRYEQAMRNYDRVSEFYEEQKRKFDAYTSVVMIRAQVLRNELKELTAMAESRFADIDSEVLIKIKQICEILREGHYD